METLKQIARHIKDIGGEAFIVGGWVRDKVLGIESKDIDVEVFKLSFDQLHELLCSYGEPNMVGSSFGILKLTIDGNDYDFSIPRRENKVGIGHKGFKVDCDPTMTLKEAAERRDFTFNAMSYDILKETILDPYNGQVDLNMGLLKAVGPKFVEDPLRILRGMQFAGRFNLWQWTIDTMIQSRDMIKEYEELSVERIWEEWKKWALRSKVPSAGLKWLVGSSWVDLYPELKDMIGCEQDPLWHPEGWSLQSISSFDSSLASSTHPTFIDRSTFTLRKLFSSSIANSTGVVCQCQTSGASISDLFINQITDFTRSDDVPSSTEFHKTTKTKPMCFMWSGNGLTSSTDKVIRVMFPISLSRVNRIVNTTVNDTEIFNSIVCPISVLVVDMLNSFQPSTDMCFHYNSMDTNAPIAFGPTRIQVPISIIPDFGSPTVDGDITCSVNFFVCDNWVHNDTPLNFNCTTGDVFVHTCHVVDEMTKLLPDTISVEDRLIMMFSALCHDLGKVSTTNFIDGHIRSRGHCEAGVPLTESFLTSIGCPIGIIERVKPLVAEHLVHVGLKKVTPKAVRRLANRLGDSTIAQLCDLVRADTRGRPPCTDMEPDNLSTLEAMADDLSLTHEKPRGMIMGRHLLEFMSAGPDMGLILEKCFEAQLDGEFSTLDEGIAFAKQLIKEA